ncbi:hypothetical protein [Streptomyces sp. 142MFCol3.1]|uniref:hypothetical protein n=1 Tax=Streptomyces sp. 142MFCol3.1 TaxID=1172179 RepID=UPI001319CAFA|nr:hypothetical protein [Streptomyces sp. 142MFCol3.1]
MTLGADVPFGPRRRERLAMNNPADRAGFNDPNVTASTDDMTDDQDRSLPPEISMSIPSERHARASYLHVRRWRRLNGFISIEGNQGQFPLGREPAGHAANAWTWEDLA